VQFRHGATKTTGKFGIAVKLLDFPHEVLRKKIVSRNVHPIPGSQYDMINATFTAVTEFEVYFIANRIGF
jgi:hypothetical protein